MGKRCPACGTVDVHVFLELSEVPVHQNLLYSSVSAAQATKRGEIHLGLCSSCGFVTNCAFNPALLGYSEEYDNTQCFSTTFNEYALNLTHELINRYSLHNKRIVEIGCGKGDFIKLLCELGPNQGVGFDPSYIGDKFDSSGRITFIQDIYSEQYIDYSGDFFCSRHVIEHIAEPGTMLTSIRRAVTDRLDVPLFMETPDVSWILRNVTFWDIFYEHCSLFSPGSLARLYARQGWDAVRITSAFGGQYMWVEGYPSSGTGQICVPVDSLLEITELAQHFQTNYQHKINQLREMVNEHMGKNMVIWGAGAKGVTFANTLSIHPDTIGYVVDVNPRKQGKFIPGTGQQIISPDALKTLKPEIVWVMNPNYVQEIRTIISEMSLSPELLLI